MDSFFKNIKTSVEGLPETKVSDRAWSSFNKHRELRQKETVTNKIPWWMYFMAASLLGLLILSNSYWISQSANGQTPTNLVSHDTIYITKYINEHNQAPTNTKVDNEDLISELKVYKSQLAYSLNELRQARKELNTLSTEFTSLQTQYRSSTQHNNRDIALANSSIFNNNNKRGSTKRSIVNSKHQSTIESLALLENKKSGVLEHLGKRQLYHPSQYIVIKKQESTDLLTAITPKSLSLRADLGFVIENDHRLHGVKGHGFGLSAVTMFSSNVRGYAGILYSNTDGEIRDVDHYPGIPNINISVGDRVKHTERKQTTLAYNIGMDYTILRVHKWRPYVGAGYSHSIFRKDNFRFEIETQDDEEYYIAPEDNYTQNNTSHLLFTIGTDYDLSSLFDLRLGMTYYKGIGSQDQSNLFFNTGIYRHF